MSVPVRLGEDEEVAVGVGEIHSGVGLLVPVVVRLAVTVAVPDADMLAVTVGLPV